MFQMPPPLFFLSSSQLKYCNIILPPRGVDKEIYTYIVRAG